MKKKLICFAMAMMLILSSSVTAFASSSGALAPSELGELGPNTSVYLVYAQLQLAENAMQQAEDLMEQIEELQKEQQQARVFLATAWQCQSDAKHSDAETEMPADMAEYMDANGLSYDTTGDDLLMTAEEWDVAITSLEHHQEELGMEMQQQMVYYQTFMTQYTSYLEGANNQISNSNQTLHNIARGQSMYGDSEVGLAVTGLVLGLVLGCAATLAVQKVRRKKDAV